MVGLTRLRRGGVVVGCGVRCHGRGAMENNNDTNPDNQPDQTPNRREHQAKKPDERTDEAGYQKLPPQYRPFAGRAQTRSARLRLASLSLDGAFRGVPRPAFRRSPHPALLLPPDASGSRVLRDAIPPPSPKRCCATTSCTSKPSNTGNPKPSVSPPPPRNSSSSECWSMRSGKSSPRSAPRTRTACPPC
jgi:hypothetical protein